VLEGSEKMVRGVDLCPTDGNTLRGPSFILHRVFIPLENYNTLLWRFWMPVGDFGEVNNRERVLGADRVGYYTVGRQYRARKPDEVVYLWRGNRGGHLSSLDLGTYRDGQLHGLDDRV